MFLQGAAVSDGDTDADGIEHMDTRQDVSRRIRRINVPNQIDEDILPGKFGRTQVQPIREDGTQDQEKSHPRDQKSSQAIEPSLVREEEITDHRRDKYKPQKIRYDEIFNKRNIIIERRMDEKVMDAGPALQIYKPRHIDQRI